MTSSPGPLTQPSFLGLGPMPGVGPQAPAEAAEILLGECLDGRLHLPVLPARGLGADSVGRTGALMADIAFDRGPRSWRIVDSPGRLSHLAADFLERDLDACEQAWGAAPQSVRLPAIGPWTLANMIENASGQLVATDRGAVRFFAQSLASGLIAQAADARRRFGTRVEVLLAEPALGAVATGAVAAPSTLMGVEGYLPAQGHRELSEILREVTEPLLADDIVVTLALSSPDGIPVQAIADSGASRLWLPRRELVTTPQLDFAAALIGSGIVLELGSVPVHVAEREEHTGAAIATAPRALAEQAALLWDELGYSRMEMTEKLSLAPVGGFAGSAVDETAAQLGAGRRAAELIRRAAGDLARKD